MLIVAHVWGGDLPEFTSQDEAEELVQTLEAGLWNRLSEHQNTRNPFRLPRFEVKPTRSARSREIRGFVDGLLGDEDEMDVLEKAYEAVAVLCEIHTRRSTGSNPTRKPSTRTGGRSIRS
jgi:hypothetical protein